MHALPLRHRRLGVRRPARRLAVAAMVLALVGATAACGADDTSPETVSADDAARSSADRDDEGAEQTVDHADGADDHADDYAKPVARIPLRRGERRLTVEMPEAYQPSAPTGVGNDDYRCFLLDPRLERDAFITGTDVAPGNESLVHHVILFQVAPDDVEAARAKDASEDGQGWTCFGGPGLDEGPGAGLDDAPWLGAWAPGGGESVQRPGYGVALEKGSQIVMQVHYNLLAGDGADVSATRLRLAAQGADLQPVTTMLLPGPVELPCRAAYDDGPLCDRDDALADVKARFGQGPGSTADLLYFLCGGRPDPGPKQSCTRTNGHAGTILGAAGHMHLLGTSIRIELNPGTPRARTLLDIPVWDFDNQAARRITPVRIEPYDTLRVTCRHSQRLRDLLPAFEGQPDRYIVWGEGSTDEMCLGILQVVRD